MKSLFARSSSFLYLFLFLFITVASTARALPNIEYVEAWLNSYFEYGNVGSAIDDAINFNIKQVESAGKQLAELAKTPEGRELIEQALKKFPNDRQAVIRVALERFLAAQVAETTTKVVAAETTTKVGGSIIRKVLIPLLIIDIGLSLRELTLVGGDIIGDLETIRNCNAGFRENYFNLCQNKFTKAIANYNTAEPECAKANGTIIECKDQKAAVNMQNACLDGKLALDFCRSSSFLECLNPNDVGAFKNFLDRQLRQLPYCTN